MILGYKKSDGTSDPYWFGQMTGPDATKRDDRKFIRVCCGLAMPIFERSSGAIVVVGQTYSAAGPVDLIVLDAYVDANWRMVENQLLDFRKKMKFSEIICDREEARQPVRGLQAFKWGVQEFPIGTDTVPSYVLTEVGRSRVDALIDEGRLHISDQLIQVLDLEYEVARLALQSVVIWMVDLWPALYKPIRRRTGPGQILGVEGL